MSDSPANKLRIGFMSAKNYLDRHTFSGTLYSMYRSLSRHADVVPLGRPYVPSGHRELIQKIENRIRHALNKPASAEAALRKFARVVEHQLDCSPVDLVFAPVASAELRFVRPGKPLVYASDTTFQCLKRTYGFEMLADEAAQADAAELSVIQNSNGITYSSRWAADSAIRDYGAVENKIRVIPYGANLDEVPESDAIFRKCGQRPWKLVFIGFYWHRKGGDIAIKAFEVLRKRNVDAELPIIGAEPPEPVNGLPIRAIRFLDKRKAADRARLNGILLSSHVMLFPARADCSPVALCEAAAYGIPVVAADVGGLPSIVTEQTGRLMPATSTPEEYADAVMTMIENPDRYHEFIRASRQRYDELLNWDKWATTLLKFCEQLI